MADSPPRFQFAFRRPCGRTFLLAAALIVLLVGLTEGICRRPAVRGRLPQPSFGLNHRNLDLRLAAADDLVARDEDLDTIFVGPSTVACGIDPAVFQTAYAAARGRTRHCYNFGNAGMTIVAAAVLAEIAVDRYRPSLVIAPIVPAELTGPDISEAEQRLLGSAWVRYHQGEFAPYGWATDCFWTWRYFLRFRQWLEYPELSARISSYEKFIDHGYVRHFELAEPQDFRAGGRHRNRRTAREFRVNPQRLAALARLLALSRRTRVVVVVMPTHPLLAASFRGGQADFDAAIETIRRRAAASCLVIGGAGVPVLTVEDSRLQDDALWLNPSHLNHDGAILFSTLLAERLAAAEGETDLLPSRGSAPRD